MPVHKFAYPWQLEIVEKIKHKSEERFNNRKQPGCVIWLEGPPGTGKSQAANVLAAMLDAQLVPDFNPTKPGHWLASIAKLAEGKPLVLVMNEANKIVKKINAGEKIDSPVKWLEIMVYDKASWNNFLDNVHNRYPNIFLMMSSNETIEELQGNGLDRSLLRKDRVDLRITVGKDFMPEDNLDIAPEGIEYGYKEVIKEAKLISYTPPEKSHED